MCAIVNAVECGVQAVFMAPTEILAVQHLYLLRKYLEPLDLTVELLRSDMSTAQRREILQGIKDGQIHVIVGTHAVMQDRVAFKKLGLVVIDEQHKFGVKQRGLLYKKGKHPDVLVMTATPIPRTLAMTLYGDLDVSVLDEIPQGRGEVVTRVIRETQLPDAYGFIKKQVAKGRQAYLVYPLVAESKTSHFRSAEKMYETLKQTVFQDERLGLVHGQLNTAEKETVMERYKAGNMDILIATTVIEVGIDIPNATIMLIEHAERFGLAQLHQLRGRIGRGGHKSFCILQGHPTSLDSWKRLKIMEKTNDGFRIAEEDLMIRGMGNLLGQEQSGFPLFRLGNPLEDGELLQRARQEVFHILKEDSTLEKSHHHNLRKQAKALYHIVEPFVNVG
ncbi:MAG: DEAD/DEAH box helicase [Kiritimatiellae bacterium]|nr:DEAD/DEAH box helicase [Kiritimatiellia bacterium]